MNRRNTGLILSILIIISLFPGCISPFQIEKESKDKIQISLEKINADLVLHPDSFQVIPIITPLVVDKKINLEINESGMIIEDISLFSSRVAITFWNNAETVFIVDSYDNLLMAAPVAYLLDAPVLVYGDTTQNVINLIKPEIKIASGNVKLNTDIELHGLEQLLRYYANQTSFDGRMFSYISLTNPEDKLSSIAPLFTVYHKGILLPTRNNDPEIIAKQLNVIYALIRQISGKSSEYLCIIGNEQYIPFYNVTITEQNTVTGDTRERTVRTDNYYGIFNGSIYTPDLAIGRIIARDLKSGIAYFKRITDYFSFLGNEKENALIYHNESVYGGGINMGISSGAISAARLLPTLNDAGFNVQYVLDPLSSKIVDIGTLVENSTLCFMMFNDNVWFDPDNTQLPPSVIFDISSFAGDISSVQWPYLFLEAGANTYIAPTFHISSPFCVLITTVPGMVINNTGDNGDNKLGRRFFEELIKDKTVGIAFRDAYKLYATDQPRDVHDPYILKFILYGDPAFNPYEPCNEGKSN